MTKLEYAASELLVEIGRYDYWQAIGRTDIREYAEKLYDLLESQEKEENYAKKTKRS